MKYTIARQFSLTNKKYDVICNGKIAATVKTSHSKQYQNQYNLELSNLISDYVGDYSCSVESDPRLAQHYSIYSNNRVSNEKTLFGELFYQINSNGYIYKIIIGSNAYDLRSCDLKYSHLALTDPVHIHGKWPNTLFQLNDVFSSSNSEYRVNIHDKEWPLGYVALTILLHLHEAQRNET